MKMQKMIMIGMAVALLGTTLGCKTLEEYQALERDNRVLQEELSKVKQDLLDTEHMIKQKDTMIDALNNQLATKDQLINNLTEESKNCQDALSRAQEILKKYADRGPGSVTIMKQALPEPLHKELMEFAKNNPNLVEYLEDKGAVRFKADLLFDLGSDKISVAPEITEALKKFAEIVESNAAAGFDVIIVGHTCTTPIRRADTLAEHKTNWHLSAHRAISIMQMLSGEGVSMDRMGIMGYGEHRPIADNSSKAGKAKNRRVEIYLVSKGSVQSMSGGAYEVKDMGLAFVRPNDF